MPITLVSDTCERVAGIQQIFAKDDRMISWGSHYHLISNREELEAYKQLPLAQRDPVLYVAPNIQTRNDKTTVRK